MADLQISQSGPFFRKISLLDVRCFYFAPQADPSPDDEANNLNWHLPNTWKDV